MYVGYFLSVPFCVYAQSVAASIILPLCLYFVTYLQNALNKFHSLRIGLKPVDCKVFYVAERLEENQN